MRISHDDARAVVHGRRRAGSGSNGASTGVKRRAQPAQHVFEHVIAADAQLVADDLHVGVAVADDARRAAARSSALVGARSRSVARRSPCTSTIAPSSSTRPSPSRSATGFSQIEQERRALLAGQHDAPAVAVVGVEHDTVDGRASRIPVPLRLAPAVTRCIACITQNRKYRCAIGSTSAGSQVSNSPSARTS